MNSTLTNLEPKVIRAGCGRRLDLPGEIRHQLLDAADTDGALALAYCRFERTAGDAPHVHTLEDELFWIESGEFTFVVGNQVHWATAGDFIFVPRLVPHAYNCTSATGTLYTAVLEAGFEDFLFHVAEAHETGEDLNLPVLAAEFGVHLSDFDDLHTPETAPLLHSAGNGEWVAAFHDRARLLVPSEHVNGRYCCALTESAAHSGPPPHVHLREDETFIILQGRYEFRIQGKSIVLEPGDVLFAPRGIPHTFEVISEEAGHTLLMNTPGGFDGFFLEAKELFESGNVTPQTVAALGERHQIEFVPSA